MVINALTAPHAHLCVCPHIQVATEPDLQGQNSESGNL